MKHWDEDMVTTEFTCPTEKQAHEERRLLINRGVSVSLIGYDPSRKVYAFDVYG